MEMIDDPWEPAVIRATTNQHRDLPSGKRLHNYGKSPFSMGKSTISMAIFNSFLLTFTRGYQERFQKWTEVLPQRNHEELTTPPNDRWDGVAHFGNADTNNGVPAPDGACCAKPWAFISSISAGAGRPRLNRVVGLSKVRIGRSQSSSLPSGYVKIAMENCHRIT